MVRRVVLWIHPKTADLTDPQNRVFLECAWEVLESAGYDPQRCQGSIGVYAGKSMSSYLSHNLFSRPDILNSVGGLEILVAGDKDHSDHQRVLQAEPEGPKHHHPDRLLDVAGRGPHGLPEPAAS